MTSLEKGSESSKERHLGKQTDKKNVGQLQENTGSATKKLREERRYIMLKESTAISVQKDMDSSRNTGIGSNIYICNSLICKVNYRLIITLIIVSLLIVGVILFLIS